VTVRRASFRRHMLPHLAETGRTAEGVVGRPAAIFIKDDGRLSG
jgi:hypothetical protein